jgi:4-amino-4-deoxy-L-arabinose transferase-like glycosyltransferase
MASMTDRDGLDAPGREPAADVLGNAEIVRRATVGFLVLGLGLRLFRYLADFPLWCDESRLAANLIDLTQGKGSYFGPLRYAQTAPVGFLLLESLVIRLLGFSTWTLRLVPILCALASVLLFRRVAGKVLSGSALLFAVAIYSVSWWPLGFASEVKPYASDALIALGLMALALQWLGRPERAGWMWALAAASVLAVPVSFPSVFVIGGVCLALAPAVMRRRTVGTLAASLTLLIAPAATFAVLTPMYQIRPVVREYLDQYWADAFPPMTEPLRLIGWLLETHTGMLFAYPIGAPFGGSVLTAVFVVVGARVLWRRGHRELVVLCIAPLGICFLAAVLREYPYGEKARTMQFFMPAVCLLAGQGLTTLLNRVSRPERRQRLTRAALAGCVALAAVFVVYTVVHPYKLRRDLQAREFAKWFWENLDHEAELACARDDLGIVTDPRHWNGAWSDYFLCYREMYSKRHREDRPLRSEAISEENPLKIVFFYERPDESPIFQTWLEEMERYFVLRDDEEYKVRGWDPGAPDFETNYYVYEFVPRADREDLEIPIMALTSTNVGARRTRAEGLMQR